MSSVGKPKLLDLFCGAGGAAMGYYQAGFDIVGVDIAEQPHYPFRFIQRDALRFVDKHGRKFAAIHASPPCQFYSSLRSVNGIEDSYVGMIPNVRESLVATGTPYVIENVAGALSHMHSPIMLCGSSFGLRVRRHRLFESNMSLSQTSCAHEWQDGLPCYRARTVKLSGVMPVYGTGAQLDGGGDFFHGSVAMGIYWMAREELSQAIPPAYTRYIGKQLYRTLQA